MALDALRVELSVVLGRTKVPLHRLLRMGRGAVIALDPGEEDVVDILANDLPIARGRILVDNGAIQVEVIDLARRPDVTRETGSSIGAAVLAAAARAAA